MEKSLNEHIENRWKEEGRIILTARPGQEISQRQQCINQLMNQHGENKRRVNKHFGTTSF